MTAPLACACAAIFALCSLASGQAKVVPVQVAVRIDTKSVPQTGRAQAEIAIRVREDIDRPYALRLDLRRGRRVVLRREHAPERPSRTWKRDDVVRYTLELRFPIDWGKRRFSHDELDICVGFVDATTGKIVPAAGRRTHDNFAYVGTCELPAALVDFDAARIDKEIEAARAELSAKRAPAAWERLAFAFRRTESYALKAKLRDALLEVGRYAPRALDPEEKRIVKQRIEAERRRYLRLVAGRMFDRKQYRGALMLLDDVGGALEEQAGEAVLGDVDEAQRVSKRREDLVKLVFAQTTAEEKAEGKALATKLGETEAALRRARELRKAKRWALARELLWNIRFANDQDLRRRAIADREAVEKDWLRDVPAEQRSIAEKAMKHPAWARTDVRVSHNFAFLGPEKLVAGIDPKSMLRFDIAYLYITDFFGRVPNPHGDRVTVYFKELWDFGGGVGGGKRIDIGRAKADARKTRVDTGLFFHELTHCVDDTRPIYGGMREGLADLGATFAYDGLGMRSQASLGFNRARIAFREDYVKRDLEYWRIPEYAPSAGFFLHFVERYGKAGSAYRWELYRRFFRAYRDCRVKDERLPNIARAFGHHLADAFGDAAFDDLIRFRWPLEKSDLPAVRREHEVAHQGQHADPGAFRATPGSPLPRDVTASELVVDDESSARFASELGVLDSWKVIGPFQSAGNDPHCVVFPPEREVDFTKEYPVRFNIARWQSPGPRPPVRFAATGWLRFTFPYQDNSAIYALTHVTVPKATRAILYARGDDDLSIFVRDALVGKVKRPDPSRNGPWRPGWRTKLADASRFEVELAAGRNKILIKVHNRRGEAGCAIALSTLKGKAIEGLACDAEAPAKVDSDLAIAPKPKSWKQRARMLFTRRSSASKWKKSVGSFKVQNKALAGTKTDKRVEWRKYTVRPGFPKDSPSNLAWLDKKLTKGLGDFELELGIDCSRALPKLCLTFQGEGKRDALSGQTLILERRGDKLRARLERYDRLVYQSAWWKPSFEKKSKELMLRMLYAEQRLSVRLGEHEVFRQVAIRPIPGKEGIGLSTWGPRTRFTQFRLRAPRGR